MLGIDAEVNQVPIIGTVRFTRKRIAAAVPEHMRRLEDGKFRWPTMQDGVMRSTQNCAGTMSSRSPVSSPMRCSGREALVGIRVAIILEQASNA